MDEVKKTKTKTKQKSLTHINEIKMTCKEHCHCYGIQISDKFEFNVF